MTLFFRPSRVICLHISDWHDTILDACRCKSQNQKFSSALAGVSQWPELINERNTTPRRALLNNISDGKRARGREQRKWVRDLAAKHGVDLYAQSGLQFDGWKLITGDPVFNIPGEPFPPPEIENVEAEAATFDYMKQGILDLTGKSEHLSNNDQLGNALINVYSPMSDELDRLVQLYDLRKDPGLELDLKHENQLLLQLNQKISQTNLSQLWNRAFKC